MDKTLTPADQRVKMLVGELSVNLQLAMARIEELTKENAALKAKPAGD
jgi:hypothetical protein